MGFVRRHIAAIVAGLGVLVLSTADFGRVEHVPFSGWDKAVHACMYAGLTAVVVGEEVWHRRFERIRLMRYAGLMTAAAVYGVLLEGVQCLLPYRSGEWSDALANTLGALLGTVIVASLHRLAIGRSSGGGADKAEEEK